MITKILIFLNFFAYPDDPVQRCTIHEYSQRNNIPLDRIVDSLKQSARGLTLNNGVFFNFAKQIEFTPVANNQIYISNRDIGAERCSGSLSRDQYFDCKICRRPDVLRSGSGAPETVTNSFRINSLEYASNFVFFSLDRGLYAKCNLTSKTTIQQMDYPFYHAIMLSLSNSPKLNIRIPCDAFTAILRASNVQRDPPPDLQAPATDTAP